MRPGDVTRRTLLQTAVAVPVAGTVLAASTTPAEAAVRHFDEESPRFAIAVLPDTQYLFDQDSSDPAPLRQTFSYLAGERADANIAFMTHLGDVTEHGSELEITLADRTFRALDGRVPYSVLAGNHDINSSTDDQRGTTAYLKAFGPGRFRHEPTFGGASPDG